MQTGGAASHVREEGAGSPAGHIRAETGQRPSAMGSSGAAVRTADQTQHSAQPHRRPRGGLGQLPCRYPRARSAGGPWEILVPGDVQRLTWVAGELSAAHVGLYPGREGSVDTRAPRGLYGHESPVWSTDTRAPRGLYGHSSPMWSTDTQAPCGLWTREPRVVYGHVSPVCGGSAMAPSHRDCPFMDFGPFGKTGASRTLGREPGGHKPCLAGGGPRLGSLPEGCMSSCPPDTLYSAGQTFSPPLLTPHAVSPAWRPQTGDSEPQSWSR